MVRYLFSFLGNVFVYLLMCLFAYSYFIYGAWGSVVVKALR
jgi:hypothetical protein